MNNEMDKVLSQLWFNIQNWVSLPIWDQIGIYRMLVHSYTQSLNYRIRSLYQILVW